MFDFVSNGLGAEARTFLAAKAATFLADIHKFDGFDRKTNHTRKGGIDYFTNQFWSAGQRQGHTLHQVPFYGCFKPALARFFIDRLSSVGDVVLDPFSGRGTVAIESALAGRTVAANDVNPLSALLVGPRLAPITLGDVKSGLDTVGWDRGSITREDLLVFYHPKTLTQLEALRAWLSARKAANGGELDQTAAWIQMAVMTRLTGHSAGFCSGRSMPPNQAITVASQSRLNFQHGPPPEKNVGDIIMAKSKQLLKDGAFTHLSNAKLLTGSAVDLAGIADASVDLTITSPPFANVIDYAKTNWMRHWFAQIDADMVAFSHHSDLRDWSQMIRRVLIEQARVLRPGGVMALEVGEIRGGQVQLEKLVWQSAEGLPFDRLGILVNHNDFTKAAACWAPPSSGTNSNRVVLLQRL